MFKNHDIWLWACLGIFGVFAARTCHKQLSAVRAATEVSLDEGIDDSENDESRNDPSVESLTRLALGPNPRTREAAANVIGDMVLQRQTYDLMLDHVVGKNRKLRDEALVGLRFILNTRHLKYPYPYILSFDAVLNCLNSWHSEAYDFETALRQMGHGYRTPHYSDALTILIRLLRFSPSDHGILSWLESYPFGGYSTVEDKEKSIQKLLFGNYCHEPMFTILLLAFRIPPVEDGLIKCNLVDKKTVIKCWQILRTPMEHLGIPWDDASIIHHRGNTARRDLSLDRTRTRARGGSFEGNLEERQIRRRRRETALVREAGRPIVEEDIFVPTHHETRTVPLDPDLSPDQSQALGTGNQVTAAEGEIISRPSTPEPGSEGASE